MVNLGYQRDDQRILDYQLWDCANLVFRGPRTDFSSPYFSILGAAQIFGRFVARPLSVILAEKLGLQAFNAGCSGAGPSFFLKRPELINIVNRGKFAVLHMMSGRSVSNSKLNVSVNQGVLSRRHLPSAEKEGHGSRQGLFAEEAYKELLRELPAEELLALREETRVIYTQQMRQLLNLITVPKILLYWSTRNPDYREGTENIGAYWADFPHFVNQKIIEFLRPFADEYVEVVGRPGLPQPLHDSTTNEPILMWSEERFPDVKLRNHNHYYPSPEMNADAADAVLPACQRLLDSGRTRSRGILNQERHILVHMHIFKNAGTSLDQSLKECFGDGWISVDPNKVEDVLTFEDLARELEVNNNITAISSHQIRFSPGRTPGIRFHPVVMLRHPILRVKSIYDYENTAGRIATSKGLHTVMASKMSFREWVEWALAMPNTAGPVANYQTRMCSFTANGRVSTDWAVPVSMQNFEEAMINLEHAYVGTTETFARSLQAIENRLKHRFPTLVLSPYVKNTSRKQGAVTERNIGQIREELGEPLFTRLCARNSYDMMLHKAFSFD